MLQCGVNSAERTQRFSAVWNHGKAEASIASRFSNDANISRDTLAGADRALNQGLIAVRKKGLVSSHPLASAARQDKGSDWMAAHVAQKGRLIPTFSFVERYQ
jgi:hypothetical protein